MPDLRSPAARRASRDRSHQAPLRRRRTRVRRSRGSRGAARRGGASPDWRWSIAGPIRSGRHGRWTVRPAGRGPTGPGRRRPPASFALSMPKDARTTPPESLDGLPERQAAVLRRQRGRRQDDGRGDGGAAARPRRTRPGRAAAVDRPGTFARRRVRRAGRRSRRRDSPRSAESLRARARRGGGARIASRRDRGGIERNRRGVWRRRRSASRREGAGRRS